MEVKLKIFRYNPEAGKETRYDEFKLDISKGKTILNCLEEIKALQDGSLSFERSCGSAICGGCGIRINSRAKLACQTQALNEVDNGSITLEPLSNFPIIKDLVVNKNLFWKRMKSVKPYFVHKESAEQANTSLTSETELLFNNSNNCVMCAICHSECGSTKIDPDFLGPAAATKAFRFMADPRDGAKAERLGLLMQNKIWNCSRQYQCIEVCPKNIDPGNIIFKLENELFAKGLTKNAGAKNSAYFETSIRKYGKINFRNWGIRVGRKFFGELLLNFKLGRKSRINSANLKKIKNYASFRKIIIKMGER